MRRVAIAVEQNWNAVPGGTARSTNRLVEELLIAGEVDLVGVHGRHRRAPTLKLPDGLDCTELPLPGRVINQTWNAWGRPSIDRWVDAHVVHAPAYAMPPTSRPVVATIHDLAFVRHPEWFTGHGVTYMTRFLERVKNRGAHVIVPSAHTAADCIAAGIGDERIVTIPWGVDHLTFDDGEVDEIARRHGVDDDTVLFVGTREPRKNLDGLARAMERLPERHLVVVGPEGWGDVSVRAGHVTGELDHRSVRALMEAAAVLVYPSHLEGFGLPVLEAMSHGTAVVTTAGTASAEVAGEGALAVDTGSPVQLAEAIESVVADRDRREILGAAGRARSREFSWSETARRTARLYERVAA